MTFSKKWKKIFYSILEWNLDLKYFIPMCTRNNIILNWSKWHILLKKISKKNDIKKTKKTFLGNGEGNMRVKFWVSTTNGLGWALSRYKKRKTTKQGDHMMRDGNHRLESFKNADLASLIFISGNTVYLTLITIRLLVPESMVGLGLSVWSWRTQCGHGEHHKHNYDKLATLICKSGTPVHLVLFKKAPFECPSPKTWV